MEKTFVPLILLMFCFVFDFSLSPSLTKNKKLQDKHLNLYHSKFPNRMTVKIEHMLTMPDQFDVFQIFQSFYKSKISGIEMIRSLFYHVPNIFLVFQSVILDKPNCQKWHADVRCNTVSGIFFLLSISPPPPPILSTGLLDYGLIKMQWKCIN